MIRSIQRSGLTLFSPTRNVKTNNIPRSGASGGTQFISGDYVYRRFTATGTLTVTGEPLICDALIVAGGGGGGTVSSGFQPGGGGSGGIIQLSSITIPIGNTTISIGAGGSATANTSGGNGGNSSITGFTAAVGGGGGGSQDNRTGKSGGSGGGGSTPSHAGGAGTSGQGFAGRAGSANQEAGGGGGPTEPGGHKTATYWDVNGYNDFNSMGGNTGFHELSGSAIALNEWGIPTSSGYFGAGQRWFGGGGEGASNSPRQVFRIPGGSFKSTSSIRDNLTANTGSAGAGMLSGSYFSKGNSGIVIVRFRRELTGQ
jgi:hypothetical protein